MLNSKARPSFTPVAVLIFLMTTACATKSIGPSEADIAAIKAMNRDVLNKMLVEQDTSALNNVALDQYLVVAPGGRVETKEQAIAGIDSLDVRGFEISKEQIIISGNTVVHVGRIDIDGTMQPMGKFPPMKMMTTFVKSDDEWRMLSRSITPCIPIAVELGAC
ncbi:MAG: nuclear transport factor 2 family protein [Marinicaulis sp.]|nr:nuclear transport factor 2 family protein [Marinicaulis sp.]